MSDPPLADPTPPREYTHPNGRRRIVILPDFVLEEITPGGNWWLLPIRVAVKPSRRGRRPKR